MTSDAEGACPASDRGDWRWRAVGSLIAGALAFGWATGGRILRPTFIDWMLHGDPAQHYFGWAFFRHAPLLQWPLGANPLYGLGIGSSIVFSDSIPLLALPIRTMSPLLPRDFQYTGFWLLLCFVLQAWFAQLLLRRFTTRRSLALAAACIFLVAPPLLWRLHGHFALCGQWLLLAALGAFLRPRVSAVVWVSLLAAAALVHAYLLFMVMAMFGIDFLRRMLARELGPRRAAVLLVAATLTTVFVMWAAGYFMLGTHVREGGWGMFRMNLLAPFDSAGEWSRVLPDLPGVTGDYEGFNFLGLGMLALLPVAALCMRRKGRPLFTRQEGVALLILCTGLTALALSNHVAIGSRDLLVYPLPHAVDPLTGVLRSSGRFFWPVLYVIDFVILGLVMTRLPSRTAAWLCVTALVVQAVDLTPAIADRRHELSGAGGWQSPLRAPFWNLVATRYRAIWVVFPGDTPPRDFIPLALLAARHGLGINAGAFARIDRARLAAVQERLREDVRAGRFERDALYVFEHEPAFRIAARTAGAADLVAEVDGLRILAPGLGASSGAARGLASAGAVRGSASQPPRP